MSRAIPFNQICSYALMGLEKAFKNYYKWSNGLWLDKAPESFIQTEIARTLSNYCPIITLEDTLYSILDNSYAETKGRNPRGSSSGRVDIVLWWKREEPRILIEVKKSWGKNCAGIYADAIRLKQLLNRGGSLQHGIILVYTDAKSEKVIKERFKQLADSTDTTLFDWLTPMKKKEDAGIWYWSAACLKVKS